MQRGDLSTEPLRSLLPGLAADGATGCLYVADPAGGEISIFLESAHVIGVRVPDAADPLGRRLVGRGALSTEVLQTLTFDSGAATTLAERLVGDQLVAADVVDAVALELAVETIDRMLAWTSGAWRFRRRQRPGRSLPEPIPVAELLENARRRAEAAAAVPAASDAASEIASGAASDVDSDVAGDVAPHATADADEPARTTAWNRLVDDDDVLESLAKASVALNDALGDAREDDESGRASTLIRSSATTSSPAPPVDPATAARRDRLRAAAAAELAAAHAEAEQARREFEAGRADDQGEPEQGEPEQGELDQGQAQPAPADHAEVVDLGARREAARAARELAEVNRATVQAPEAAPAAADTAAEPAAETAAESSVEPSAAPAAEPVGGVAAEPVAEAPLPSPPSSPGPAPSPAASAAAAPHAWQTGTADHLAATALLREMAGAAAPAAVPPAPPVPAPVEVEPATPTERGPAASGLLRPNAPGGSADTAALLRELSSLGDDAPARSPVPTQRPSNPGAHAAAANRRRKGLWGRS